MICVDDLREQAEVHKKMPEELKAMSEWGKLTACKFHQEFANEDC